MYKQTNKQTTNREDIDIQQQNSWQMSRRIKGSKIKMLIYVIGQFACYIDRYVLDPAIRAGSPQDVPNYRQHSAIFHEIRRIEGAVALHL